MSDKVPALNAASAYGSETESWIRTTTFVKVIQPQTVNFTDFTAIALGTPHAPLWGAPAAQVGRHWGNCFELFSENECRCNNVLGADKTKSGARRSRGH